MFAHGARHRVDRFDDPDPGEVSEQVDVQLREDAEQLAVLVEHAGPGVPDVAVAAVDRETPVGSLAEIRRAVENGAPRQRERAAARIAPQEHALVIVRDLRERRHADRRAR